MSWKATAWAKETRGHKGLASKVVLLVLADYHDTEKGYAWPTQQRLANDCEMSIRGVKYALKWLEGVGFLTTLQRGNQHQPTHYRMNLDVALAQSCVGAVRGSAMVALTGEGANGDRVKVQMAASEGAILVHTSLHEPPLEPPVSTEGVWPDWYSTLWAIPGFKMSIDHCAAWLTKKGIQESYAEQTAYALKGKWPGSKKNPYKDVWATFQNWVVSPSLGSARPANMAGVELTQEERLAKRRRDSQFLRENRAVVGRHALPGVHVSSAESPEV